MSFKEFVNVFQVFTGILVFQDVKKFILAKKQLWSSHGAIMEQQWSSHGEEVLVMSVRL